MDVYLDKLPGDIEDIAAATISYTYDKDVLAYKETISGALNLTEGESAKDGNISWFTGTPIEDIDNTHLFTLVFDVVADTDATTIVGIGAAEIASSSYAISEYVETGKVQIDIVKEVPAEAAVSFGNADIQGDMVYIPVTMNRIPSDLKDIAAFTFRYTYSDKLIYETTQQGAFAINADNASDGSISWMYNTASVVTDVTSPLFTLVFRIASGAEGEAELDMTFLEVADSDRKISEKVTGGSYSFMLPPIAAPELTGITANITAFEVPYGTTDVLAAVKAAITEVKAVYDIGEPVVITEYTVELNADSTKAIITYENKSVEIVLTYEAAPTPKVTFGPARVEGTKAYVPVSLNIIPEGLADIASFDMPFTYTTELLTFAGVEAGTMPVTSDEVSGNKGSWFSSVAPVTDVTGTLFTLVFDVKDNVSGLATVGADEVEIAASNHTISTVTLTDDASFNVVGGTVVPVITGIKTNISDINIPLNTPDVVAYIRSQLKVYAVYNTGAETEITTSFNVEVVNGEVKVSYGNFVADAIDMTYTKAQLKAGDAVVDTAERTFRIPVTMDGILADIANIASVTIAYTYDPAVEYIGTEAGIIPVDATTATDGNVSWYSSTAPVTAVDNATLFTLVFKAPCDADAAFDIVLNAEIADSAAPSANIQAIKGTVSVSPVPHNWGEWETTTAPTLDADGVETRVCSNCDKEETRPVTLTDITINKDAIEVPHSFHSQGADKKMAYIKSQIVAKAVFSDETEIAIPEESLTFTDNDATVKVAFKDKEKDVTITLGAAPANPEVYPDIPQQDDNREVKVPIVISDIPDEIIHDIESIEFTYTFDTSKLHYKDTDGADGNLNPDGSEAGKVVIDVTVAVDVDEINHTAKAIITFFAPCNVEGDATIDITGISINGTDVSEYFSFGSIDVTLVAQDCVYGEWHVPAGTNPADYKNGKEIRICQLCGGVEERPIRVTTISSAVIGNITVPYENHSGKTAAEIANYIKTLGTLATAQLTTGVQANLDNADIVVTVDVSAAKATITYLNAYNPNDGTTYDATFDIPLVFGPSQGIIPGPGGGSPGGSIGGGYGGGGAYAPNVSTSTFSDVPNTHYAYEASKDLYNRGIISGDDQGRINPDLGITREETAKVALLINGIAIEKGLPIDFADKANVSDWAYDYVATAIKYGILKGYGDGTVRPRDTVSREEMVAIVIRAFNVQVSGNAESKYTDVEDDRWSVGYIKAASDLGLITGYGDGTFKPGADIKRAEAFTIYYRVLKFKETLAAVIQ